MAGRKSPRGDWGAVAAVMLALLSLCVGVFWFWVTDYGTCGGDDTGTNPTWCSPGSEGDGPSHLQAQLGLGLLLFTLVVVVGVGLFRRRRASQGKDSFPRRTKRVGLIVALLLSATGWLSLLHGIAILGRPATYSSAEQRLERERTARDMRALQACPGESPRCLSAHHYGASGP